MTESALHPLTMVHQEIGSTKFASQGGYSAFTVSAPNRWAVQKYIANQEQHHHQRSFREELISMLEQAGIDYDPKYLD